MSTAGIFLLISNDGKQDLMLMATSLLNQRLIDVRQRRAAMGLDESPTLLDIEMTHILFPNAHFKPFAAIGYEYNVVNIQTGSIQWGAEITFSIPQFGDFFCDMAIAVTLNQPQITNATVSTTSDNYPLMRWCARPGERIFDYIKFDVNGNPLDDYTSHEVNFFREFCIAPNKILGWNRLTGQEESERGFVDQPRWVGSGVQSSNVTTRQAVEYHSGLQTPTGQKTGTVSLIIPLLFWFNQDVRLAIPSVAIPQGARYLRAKLTDSRNMAGLVPRGTGTWASPNATLDFTNVISNVQLYINNLFVNPEIHNIFIKRVGFTLIRVRRRQTLTTNQSAFELHCSQLKWPIENIAAGMKMSDYNSSTAALQAEHLDKWHLFNQVVPQTRTANGWLENRQYLSNSALTVLGGSAITGYVFNNSANDATRLTLSSVNNTSAETVSTQLFRGDILTFTSGSVSLNLTVYSVVDGTTGPSQTVITFEETTRDVAAVWGTTNVTVATTAGDFTVSVSRTVQAAKTSTVWTYVPTLSQVQIKAHGINLYDYFPSNFYSDYLPYTFGGPNLNVPQNRGCLFINFCLYPFTYQPSSHVNISRAREFYFNFVSSVIGGSPVAPSVVNQPVNSTPSNTGYLYLLASAINFLLISDGGAVLRYST